MGRGDLHIGELTVPDTYSDSVSEYVILLSGREEALTRCHAQGRSVLRQYGR
jgi:hypothetical protein